MHAELKPDIAKHHEEPDQNQLDFKYDCDAPSEAHSERHQSPRADPGWQQEGTQGTNVGAGVNDNIVVDGVRGPMIA